MLSLSRLLAPTDAMDEFDDGTAYCGGGGGAAVSAAADDDAASRDDVAVAAVFFFCVASVVGVPCRGVEGALEDGFWLAPLPPSTAPTASADSEGAKDE